MDRHSIAAVDAASGTEINATIRLNARGTPILGAYVTIPSGNDLILGRILSVAMNNPIHENEAFTPVIMKNGCIPHFSAEVDIERAVIKILAVRDVQTGERVALRRNPASGTSIMLADQIAISEFATESEHFLILGHIPNSGGLYASIVNRHFGPAADKDGNDLGGYGEARHTAIVGQNGSAKSVLLTALIAGKLSAHNMGLLMPDTSGDLCNSTKHNRGSYKWDYFEVLRAAGIEIEVMSINDVRLTSGRTLAYKLAPFLKNHLSSTVEKCSLLADRVVEEIFQGERVNAGKLTGDAIQQAMIKHIPQCWDKKTSTDKLNAAQNLQRRSFDADLERIRTLFDGRWAASDLIDDILGKARKIIFDFGGLMSSDHRFVMREIMEAMTRKAQRMFHAGAPANAMAVLDEAQRFAPQAIDDDDAMTTQVIDGIRTTRKCGVGWFIVTQSPVGVAKDVLRQCHTYFCGRNLGLGADSEHLKDMLTEDGAKAYEELGVQGGYYWVACGLDSNIGSGRSWFAIHPFGGDATMAFLKANRHIFKDYYNNIAELAAE
jgi:hypothetical protein